VLILCCKVNEENTVSNGVGDGASNPVSDSVSKFPDAKGLDTSGNYVEEHPKPNRVIITSANIVFPERNNAREALRVIEIQNTKVIKQNSNFSDGRIVYKIPNIMKVRSTYKVLVRISKSKATVSLYDSLQGTVMTSKIPVSETMECKLIDLSPKDNPAFEIADGNSAVQIIENGDTYTEWSWGVTPIKVGSSNLKIVVSVIRDGNKKDIVYEDTVEVEIDVFNQVLFFLKKYWYALMTSMAVPFVVWLYKNRKEKRSGRKRR